LKEISNLLQEIGKDIARTQFWEIGKNFGKNLGKKLDLGIMNSFIS
jgi:hypothetical protein